MKEKIIIFGGSGFIGSNLINKIKNLNYDITSVSRKKILNKKKYRNIRYISCDVSNFQSLKKIKSNYDYIINLSGNIDHQNKIEVITALILSGLVFKEYVENYEYSLKELEKLIETFFDDKGFPLTRSPNDLLNFTKYFLLIKEVIKDAQKYVPEILENIIEKNLECLKHITTPNK